MVALQIRLAAAGTVPSGMLALPVAAPADGGPDGQADGGARGRLLTGAFRPPAELAGQAEAFLADVDHGGDAGTVTVLPRPGQRPRRLLLLGTGEPAEGDWRDAGAGLVRAADGEAGTTGVTAVTVALPDGAAPELVGAFAEGALLAAYRFSLASEPDGKDHLGRVTLAAAPERVAEYQAAVDRARVVAEVTSAARDWTNTPSSEKTPAWLADQVGRAARAAGLDVRVREPERLRAEGFGGILAVGGSSPRQPRLVELRYRPRPPSRRAAGPGGTNPPAADAYRHVVLVGKGITFDTGGIDIKTNTGLQLMRKDMGGAAAVAAATVGAARLGLPVRVTALLPLADNAVDGDAFRPGDVIRHYGGLTSEVLNTDAEGRLVLADALAYAVRRLAPDVLVDLATLTGAQNVALGKKTAALFSEDDALAAALAEAGEAVGERTWRMPLHDDYLELLRSSVADVTNIEMPRQAGSVAAALFLREFTGTARRRWAHLDMSSPAWSSSADGPLAKGATGWGVRLLLRFLAGLTDGG